MLVYDITNRESFNNIGKWLDETKSYANDKITTFLVGNKQDLESKYLIIYIDELSCMTMASIQQERMGCILWNVLLRLDKTLKASSDRYRR